MVRRQRRTGLLDDRARVILAALVEEHIRTAIPVGSMALSAGYDLGVSPATVRGVLDGTIALSDRVTLHRRP